MAARVVVYRTPSCPYCELARALLERKGASVTEIDVSGMPGGRRWLREATGQRTVPQVFVNGRPIGGYAELVSLDAQGLLDQLLAEPASGGQSP